MVSIFTGQNRESFNSTPFSLIKYPYSKIKILAFYFIIHQCPIDMIKIKLYTSIFTDPNRVIPLIHLINSSFVKEFDVIQKNKFIFEFSSRKSIRIK